MAIIGRRRQEAQHLREAGQYLAGTQSLKKNRPCNTEDNLHAELIVIEAWFGGYRGSPGLGGIRTARLYPLAGLLDYEDTRLKTLSRVRMGLSLAWKASLAVRICRSPSL